MRRVHFVEDMASTPFMAGPRRSSLVLPGVEIVDTPDAADVLCARSLGALSRHFHLGKALLVWTHEPAWCGVSEKSVVDTATGLTINMSTTFNGEVYISPLHYFPFQAIDRKALLDSLADRPKFCAILATYRAKFDRYIGGRNVDITEFRQRLAIDLHLRHDACDIFGRGWPEQVKTVEESRGAGWQSRKLGVLADYRFNVACENTVTLNYVTEKIWQAIQSGCIPIYFAQGTGIEGLLSSESYVDPGGFQSTDELHAHLAALDPASHYKIVDSAIADYQRILEGNRKAEIAALQTDRFAARITEIS